MYRKRSRKRVLSARPNLELRAFCNEVRLTKYRYFRHIIRTEYVLWMVLTAEVDGILILNGAVSLLRNFDWTVGRP